MEYRTLATEEIEILQHNGCRCDQWSLVRVEKDTSLPHLRRVWLEGEVSLGADCRIADTTIANCSIGRRTRIRNAERIENYDIGADCDIYNCGSITAGEYAAMGCGTTVDVLDETGGRRLTICPKLTAQVAYMLTFYRHDPRLTSALNALVEAWGEAHRTRRGQISDGVTMCYVTAVDDVCIGPRSVVRSAVKLQNGTLGADTQVLENVSAADFILSDGATLGTTCVAKHVFLGQAARLGNGFVAHNSLIFANSVLECGETDALFAGPHTVSFHRSTLLIAAALSFFNAGSGTNQSNHYYCTGPVHHGIMERGCKTGSNSYVKWPARLGQFSVVIGSHSNHPDTSDLPFSYLFGNSGATTVIPAANMKTCGIMRDVLKWRGRDARGAAHEKLDCINYDEFTPYNAERMAAGIRLLKRMQERKVSADELHYTVNPIHIHEGKKLYRLGLLYFFGKAVAERILTDGPSPEALARCATDVEDIDKWVDMAGMLAPRAEADRICRQVVSGDFATLEELNEAIAALHRNYTEYRWQYILHGMHGIFGHKPSELTADILAGIVRQWSEAARELCRLRTADAQKDFSPEMCVGFGIDHPELAQADFENVRGRTADNPHIKAIAAHYAADLQLADEALQLIEQG